MKNQTQIILREIQKNAYMELEAVDALMPSVRDTDFARELLAETKIYGAYYEKATEKLMQAEKRLYGEIKKKNRLLRAVLWVRIFGNGSSANMAKMMIQRSDRGITDMYRALNQNRYADGFVYELAQELLAVQEENIIRLRKYL